MTEFKFLRDSSFNAKAEGSHCAIKNLSEHVAGINS